MAAPYMGLDPFETADQDDYLEVRAEASLNSRVEELYDKFVETVEKMYPDDKPKRERLIKAFMDEQHGLKLLAQEVDQKENKEQKATQKKKGEEERLEAQEPRP